ncbi:MAG: hypothetical protein WAS33_01205 [Candidatus Promineifilaceae bacterium]
MSNSHASAMPQSAHETAGSSGGRQEVKWVVVAQMPGITPATIVAGRLNAEGFPVRVWQEGAGQALGLTVGLLGTGYVAVPEPFANQALELLAQEEDPEALAEQFDDFDESAFVAEI